MCSMISAECKIVFNKLDIEVGEVGSVLKHEQLELDSLGASYTILNPHVPLLAPHLSFSSISNMCIGPNQFSQCYLEHANAAS